jgi:hypothetical protein
LGLGVTLILFLSLKAEMHQSARRERRRIDEALARLDEAKATADPEPIFVPAPGPTSINVNRRVHALRLLRKGEDLSHIAAALGIPRTEVELLVRVQNFVSDRQAAAAATSD